MTDIDEKALESALKTGLAKFESSVVVPAEGKMTKQEAAVMFNFQECLRAAVKGYLRARAEAAPNVVERVVRAAAAGYSGDAA